MPSLQLDCLVFDAYGTLYDVHSVMALAETRFPGHGAAISQLWRTKQLEYTWLKSMMGHYENFNVLTEAGLRYALEALKLQPTADDIAALLTQYTQLATFPEVDAALAALKPRRMAILSNGAPDTLNALVKHSGLDTVLDAVISVDAARVFKPDMRIYQLAMDQLSVANTAKNRIGFVSSNGWDAAGAKAFGFTTFWINRTGAPVERHAAAPDYVISSVADVAQYVQ